MLFLINGTWIFLVRTLISQCRISRTYMFIYLFIFFQNLQFLTLEYSSNLELNRKEGKTTSTHTKKNNVNYGNNQLCNIQISLIHIITSLVLPGIFSGTYKDKITTSSRASVQRSKIKREQKNPLILAKAVLFLLSIYQQQYIYFIY